MNIVVFDAQPYDIEFLKSEQNIRGKITYYTEN